MSKENELLEMDESPVGVLSWLRSKGSLLIIIIGFALVAFVVGDALTTGRSIFGSDDNTVLSINGEKIDNQAFSTKLNRNLDNYRAQTRVNTLDEATEGYLADQTFTQTINEALLKEAVTKSGIAVGDDEKFDLLQGKFPDQDVVRQFTDPNTGQFNRNQVLTFLKNFDQQTPEVQAQWGEFKSFINEKRQREKYTTLITKGVYVPTLEAKIASTERSIQALASVALVDYTTIVDSTIKVTESELADNFNKNKFKYKQREDQRSFEYIYVDVLPSKADTAELMTEFNTIAADFKTTANDTTFVNLNSESGFAGTYLKKSQLTKLVDTNLYNAAPGTVYGPFVEGGFVKVVKLMNTKNVPDSVKARHILIEAKNGDVEAAKAKADSIKKLIQGGANFAQLAIANSSDKGSAEKGGDLGTFGQGQMVPEFNNACFEGKTGDMPVVTTKFGVHIIDIQDQKNFNKSLLLGNIQRAIVATNATSEAAFAKANALRSGITSTEDFDKVVPTAGVFKQVAENVGNSNKFLNGIQNPKAIIKWAYEAKVGDISEVLTLGSKYAFGKLTAVKTQGEATLENVKTLVETAVRKEKKAEQITAKLKGATTAADAATKGGTTVKDSVNINFSSSVIAGFAREPKVAGVVATMVAGKTSAPIAGERGVYVVQVIQVPTAPAADLKLEKMALQAQFNSQFSEQQLLAALKNKAKIADNRIKMGY